ncbi:MarR family winged helix-turn-helix transcriptional regulator [Niabella ginsengisoli]|uniref:MarR family transcriptional regulator n=1 Tax=Niabella ginsengisoli TaxID=522298 RepID=A0ABS9SPT9_9BACT|nr:MarR family transcriptional regulator [Niabella ginsengisoli]MCH5600372.1 MarR family transcriptional regulator [Niabella ginsengisoli]
MQKKFNTADLNLTIEQWSVLYHLWKEDGISQQDLCQATFRDKPSMTRLVDNLEKAGLVKRSASKTDRRKNLITLTEKAKAIQDTCHGFASETVDEALAGVRDADIEVCKVVLKQVYENLK